MFNGAFIPYADARTATSADIDDVFGDVWRQPSTLMLPVHVDSLVTLSLGRSTAVCGADDGSSLSSTCIWYHSLTPDPVLSSACVSGDVSSLIDNRDDTTALGVGIVN